MEYGKYITNWLKLVISGRREFRANRPGVSVLEGRVVVVNNFTLPLFPLVWPTLRLWFVETQNLCILLSSRCSVELFTLPTVSTVSVNPALIG